MPLGGEEGDPLRQNHQPGRKPDFVTAINFWGEERKPHEGLDELTPNQQWATQQKLRRVQDEDTQEANVATPDALRSPLTYRKWFP